MRNSTTRILAQDKLISNDTWVTGINNNDLIIGPSGAGKTRNYVKPNLLQCALEGGCSLVVADTKGSLIQEVGPVLAAHGYTVINLDFIHLTRNTWGYNPLDYVRYDNELHCYSQQDIVKISNCLNPVSKMSNDPFWDQSAQFYLTALIAYVLEALPKEEHNLTTVSRLYTLMNNPNFPKLFQELYEENPNSYAYRTYKLVEDGRMVKTTYNCIRMLISRTLAPLTFDGPNHLYQLENRLDFRQLGREKTAVFLTISDSDRSLDRLTNLFYSQVIDILFDSAFDDYPDHRLAVPVRFILDDFATNVVIPDFDKLISVIRSREIYVSLIIQSINQLYSVYDPNAGKTIINNCDNCLYLGGQDIDTSNFISIKANRTQNTILNMPLGDVWLFTRGRPPQQVQKYDLLQHPLYHELPEAGGSPAPAPAPEICAVPPVDETPIVLPEPDFVRLPDELPGNPAPIQLTQSQFRSLEGRKQMLADKAAKLEQLLSGRSLRTLPELLDEQGHHSEKKTWALVDQLIANAQFCCQSQEGKVLKVQEQACLRSFFYCALRLSASRPSWLPEIKGTFQDLLLFTQRMDYPEKADLHFAERYMAAMDDFFGWMDEAYQLLSGLPVPISAADEQVMRTLYWEAIASVEPEESDEDFDQEAWESEQQDAGAWAVEDLNSTREKQTQQDWAEGFPDAERFCQRYVLLRYLYFDAKLYGKLSRIVEQALDVLLQERSKSLFLDDDAFTAVCTLLDQAAEQLAH